MFFVATLLVILMTLECLGDPSAQVESTTHRSRTVPTRAGLAKDPHALSYPSREADVQNYGSQQSGTLRTSQNQGVQTQSSTPRGSQAQNTGEVQTRRPTTDTRIQSSVNETIADPAVIINAQLRQFGLNLLIKLSELDQTSNLILSPFSVWSVLLLLLEGARGMTASQIRSALHLPDDAAKIRSNYKFIENGVTNAKGSADFSSINAVFFDKNRPIHGEFQRTAEFDYHSEVHSIDFSRQKQTIRAVNAWVANKTRNRITHLLHEGDLAQPQLLVSNAIYFRGMWETPFNSTATAKAKFFDENNVHIANVDMMYQKGVYLYSYISEIEAQVLDMPYKGADFRMLIVLPQMGNNLLNVYKAMKRFPVNECYKRLLEEQEMYSESEVPVYLPRFKVKNDLTLNVILENLGIEDVFRQDLADLSGIATYKIFLNRLIHISEIEVNERGTTASAATGALFVNKQQPPKFVGNRPFAFFIVENSRKTVIFAGRVLNPNKLQ